MKITKEKSLKVKHFLTFCLIGFISVLTLFGTACTPTQSNTNQETTPTPPTVQSAPSALGLDPKTDPIIYTTESGLEIKYGGIDLNLTESGALEGYPYFTMGKYDNNAVNWVIIGRAENLTAIDNSIKSYIFSNWQSNKTILNYAKYFFENIYDTKTPAGIAINNSIAQTAFMDYTTINLSKPTPNPEIDDDCVLAIADFWFQLAPNSNDYNTSTIPAKMKNLYETDLNLTTDQQNAIKPQSFTNISYSGTSNSTNQNLFALAGRGEKFTYSTYLDSATKLAAIGPQTFRSGAINQRYYAMDSYYGSGTVNTNNTGGTYIYDKLSWRPACVISLQ